ncbi:MAG: hypothetical protein NC396_07990 [Bacteroides sp.]|nr:hypothetical protein [Bacteroides sp.]MCM1086274.1 hypothetical protein [Bacteroides sp.]
MRLFLLCLCNFFLCVPGFCQTGEDADTLPAGAEFRQFFHANGAVSSEGYFVNGQPEGVWKNYDESGNLISEGPRRNLQLHGKWTFYAGNRPVREIHYQNGRKNGASVHYDPDRTVYENFVNDTLQGLRRVTDTAGVLLQTTRFRNGLENGFDKRYNAYGDVSAFTFFKNGMISFRHVANRRDRAGRMQGEWKDFHENGVLHWECTYQDGLKDGYYKEYDSLGNLLVLRKYVLGILQEDAPEIAQMEVHTEYYLNGMPKFRVGMRNGRPEGMCRQYDSLTGKVVQGIFFKDGEIVGKGAVDESGNLRDDWQEFYPDGKLRCIGQYYKGRKYGKWKYFYPDGRLEQEGEYRNDRQDGRWVWYFPNGEVRQEQEYYQGKLDGASVEYNDSLQVVAKGSYVEGLEDGHWEYLNGNEFMEGSYSMGERHGLWRSYWTEKGRKKRLSFQGSYANGLPDGQHRHFDENGVLREEGFYRMGSKTGTWIYYDRDGNPEMRVKYDQNEEEVRYNGKRTLSKKEEEEYLREQDGEQGAESGSLPAGEK